MNANGKENLMVMARFDKNFIHDSVSFSYSVGEKWLMCQVVEQ